MFIILLTYTQPLARIDEALAAHVAFLNQQYERGVFVLSGRKVPRTGGVIVATAANRQSLDAVLAQDPFFQQNLAQYEVVEFEPTKSSAALRHLIAK